MDGFPALGEQRSRKGQVLNRILECFVLERTLSWAGTSPTGSGSTSWSLLEKLPAPLGCQNPGAVENSGSLSQQKFQNFIWKNKSYCADCLDGAGNGRSEEWERDRGCIYGMINVIYSVASLWKAVVIPHKSLWSKSASSPRPTRIIPAARNLRGGRAKGKGSGGHPETLCTQISSTSESPGPEGWCCRTNTAGTVES